MSAAKKSALRSASEAIGIGVTLIALLTAAGSAFVKLADLQTVTQAQAQHKTLRDERTEILERMERENRAHTDAMLVEMKYTSGIVECVSRQIAWEDCPTVKKGRQ